jgi:hypothetical protein
MCRLIGREQRAREAEMTNTRDGGGAVRIEDHIESDIAEVWSSLAAGVSEA